MGAVHTAKYPASSGMAPRSRANQFVQRRPTAHRAYLFQAGAAVTADTVLMELSNPELEQVAFDPNGN